MSNMAFTSQTIDIEVPHGSRDRVIVPNNVKVIFTLDFELTAKTLSTTKKVDRAFLKNKDTNASIKGNCYD